VPGLRNFYVACAVMAGFSQGGGVGLSLANWITDGDPGMDVFAMDVARLGDFATRAYTNVKVRENYSRRFSITFPNEELPAGRPLRTTPIYDRLAARGAVFGAAFGLEHALWFAPEGADGSEVPTFRRSNAHDPVGRECRAVREGVGILEIANYGKHEVVGPGAAAWLDRLLAGRLPEQGRIALAPMLSPKGRLMGDLTVARVGPERFMIVGSMAAERFHRRWFEAHLPGAGVAVRPVSTERLGSGWRSPGPGHASCSRASPTTTSRRPRCRSSAFAPWMSGARRRSSRGCRSPASSASRSMSMPPTSLRCTTPWPGQARISGSSTSAAAP
jgi:dimethylglycine dehydrogenase